MLDVPTSNAPLLPMEKSVELTPVADVEPIAKRLRLVAVEDAWIANCA